MLWDNEYYYILAQIKEPHVWADIEEHDAVIFHNNDFEVFIDPKADVHGYYEIEVNALNTIWDLFITKPYRDAGNETLNEWEMLGVKSAISIDGTLNNPTDIDEGWTVELAIPFKSLRTGYYDSNVPKDKFWKVNFSRVNWDYQLENNKYSRKLGENGKHLPEYNWVWSPQGIISMHQPETWGYVYFSSKKPGQKDEFVIPNEEKIKLELYRLYRQIKKDKKTEWPSKIDAIQKTPFKIDGVTVLFNLELHQTGWNLSAISPFSNKTLVVTKDGQFIKQ